MSKKFLVRTKVCRRSTLCGNEVESKFIKEVARSFLYVLREMERPGSAGVSAPKSGMRE